jgi:hypothetical protein
VSLPPEPAPSVVLENFRATDDTYDVDVKNSGAENFYRIIQASAAQQSSGPWQGVGGGLRCIPANSSYHKLGTKPSGYRFVRIEVKHGTATQFDTIFDTHPLPGLNPAATSKQR